MYDRFYTLVSKSNRTKLGKFYFESNGPSLIRPNQVFELQGVIKFKQMKNNKFHTVGTVSKSTRKIVERGKIEAPNAHIHVYKTVDFPCLVHVLQ